MNRAPEDAGPAGPSRLSRLVPLLRLILTAATLAVIAWYFRAGPRFDAAALALRWPYLALAAACLAPMLLLRAAKWRAILRRAAPDATLAQSLRSYLGALALGMITPGRVGEFSRGLYLPQAAVQGWRGAGLVLVDNWTDFLAVLAWSCLGGWIYFGPAGAGAALAVLALFGPVPAWVRLGGRAAARMRRGNPGGLRLRWTEWADKAVAAAACVDGGAVARAFGLGFAAYALEWAQMALLIAFLSPVHPPLWSLAGTMACVTLANTVQVTLAGLGMREGLAMLLLAREGIDSQAAVTAAFLQSALILFLPAALGLAIRPAALYGGAGSGSGSLAAIRGPR